jgi:hypothetical protein
MVINSAHHLAHGLNERLKLGLTPRPWNLYSPADTFWWLVPSSEWPAYRYGKLAFSLSKDVPRKDLLGLNDSAIEPDAIFAGFNVEKGYGKVATVVNPALNRKPAQIIDPRWLWFEVVVDSGAARFGRTLAAVAAGADICLYIVSSYAHDRETDTRAQHDALMFKCSAVGLSLVLKNGFPVNVLRGADTETDFVGLARRLRAVDDYHWVDLYVGTHVPKGDVDLLALHNKVLSYFDAWLR